jgi:hypothetical protein
MSAPVFSSFQSSCRVGSQMTTNTSHHQHRRKTASTVRSAVLPSRQTTDVHVQGLSHGNSSPEGTECHGAHCPHSITADCCCCTSLVEALLDNVSASYRTSLLPASTLCCGQKKDGSTITQYVEIRGLQLHHASCQVPRPRSTATRCMLQVPKVGSCL